MGESTLTEDTDPVHPSGRDPLGTIAAFAESLRSEYVERANALIHRMGIEPSTYSGEDAFQDALLDLCRRIVDGAAPSIRTNEWFRKAFGPRVRECIVDERRRQHAMKRGGRRVSLPLSLVLNRDFDPVDTWTRPPEEWPDAEDRAEWLLALLDREDRSLRETVVLRSQDLSIAEIASRQNVSTSTVERRIRRIRSIWAPHAMKRPDRRSEAPSLIRDPKSASP